MARQATPQLGYTGTARGSLNDRKRRIARTADELDAIRAAGVVVAPAKRRHTKGHHTRVNSHGTRAIGLTDTTVTRADGTTYIIPRRKPRTPANPTTVEVMAPARAVRIRRRTLRGTISDYITVADAYGLDATNVANAYRDRANNGYMVEARIDVATAGASWQTDNR